MPLPNTVLFTTNIQIPAMDPAAQSDRSLNISKNEEPTRPETLFYKRPEPKSKT
jgi:hypothetical protein